MPENIEIPVPEILHVHEALGRTNGEFLGRALMAKEFTSYIVPHWPNQRIKAVATALSESRLRVGAYNDNYDSNSVRVSRDCGAYQDNIPASLIGTEWEFKLRTVELDIEAWEPVLKYNVQWAYNLWATRNVIRDGKLDYRRWNPWVGYTSGWATFPMLYAWHHDKDGFPIGPWVEAGRYLHNAIRGVANWEHLIAKRMNAMEALSFARFQADQWGIPETWCAWDYTAKKAVYYIPRPKPISPPTEHENWGYPVRNDGR